uniref:Uncharacterized protein n=1 Tax=Anguilla anguilla TaxID=7936 RepID=A0A0E9PI29_ANGAN
MLHQNFFAATKIHTGQESDSEFTNLRPE